MITVFGFTYNSKDFLPLFFDTYKYADRIVIVDNNSTDDTQKTVLERGAELVVWDAEYNESSFAAVKNRVWKDYEDTWCLVVDVDELIPVIPEVRNTNEVYRFVGWDVVTKEQIDTVDSLVGASALRNTTYDKPALFHSSVTDINFSIGATHASPDGAKVVDSRLSLFHAKMAGKERYLFTRKDYIDSGAIKEKDFVKRFVSKRAALQGVIL